MSIQGKWRIVEMPDYETDFPDMIGPGYILSGKSGGEFAFGRVTGAIHGTVKAIRSSSPGPAMTKWKEACGAGRAELQEGDTLEGQICFQGGDEADFTAESWHTSTTAC